MRVGAAGSGVVVGKVTGLVVPAVSARCDKLFVAHLRRAVLTVPAAKLDCGCHGGDVSRSVKFSTATDKNWPDFRHRLGLSSPMAGRAGGDITARK
ncbi:hypothetical protein C4K68_25685 [Pokkaliibacter plantistimulans]|uniref:Uncharacterized protein n=1 Tax=Proteobacteria bacterium 228 TaxID=2083153 RepID=A0A2S5KI67_9PROT|nr:hypothetical protein C4K68_25685 [Pokkaliibacter plantistimulans]